MGKIHSQVNLQIETAQSALAVMRDLINERMRHDDAKEILQLRERASNALDTARSHIVDVRSKVADAIDML
jgi:hypothetical protein